MESKSLVGKLLVIIAFALAVWVSWLACQKIFMYQRLGIQTIATIEKIEVHEVRTNQYALFSTFWFEIDHEKREGHADLPRSYPNKWAAEEASNKIKVGSQLPLWVNPMDLSETSFSKNFPWKETCSAMILLSVALYFLCIGWFVNGRWRRG